MNKFFYPKLASINIKKNSKFYLPYILACTGIIGMFYIMCAITYNDGMSEMPSANEVATIMGLGNIVIGIFSAIFLFYTNSFLMKRRKKEFGLYNILGMEKRHIGKILFFETIMVFIVSTLSGLAAGIVLDKLITLFLYKLLGFSIPLKFSVSIKGIVMTLLLFCIIFFAILMSNFIQIKFSNPIELLHGSNTGEKEPKTKVVMAILGILCLGGGYWIALVTESPLEAINLFFVAVLLVIAGTFLLFTSGSIAFLKLLRKNKKYYYKTKHFTSVSGMIYRMKQNAAGLANICILSTMMLVMVSTSVSMYIGVEDAIINRYPKDILVTVANPEDGESEKICQKVQDTVKQQGRIISDLFNYKYLEFTVEKNNNSFITNDVSYSSKTATSLTFVTSKEYLRITGKNAVLSDDEVLIYCKGEKIENSFTLFDKTYNIKNYLDSSFVGNTYTSNILKSYFIVVNDDSVLNTLYNGQLKSYGKNASSIIFDISFNIDGNDDDKINCSNALNNSVKKEIKEIETDEQGNERLRVYYPINIECRQAKKDGFYALYGGLLFLGLFLGLIFLMATVLIIYYKQISEGYDDKNRFEIMQKVGMSREEVRSSIKSQVLKIFFIPIIMAAIHILAAFKMITKLLALLNLTNVSLFAWCTVACVIIFFIIYVIVYALTAKVYYKIVC